MAPLEIRHENRKLVKLFETLKSVEFLSDGCPKLCLFSCFFFGGGGGGRGRGGGTGRGDVPSHPVKDLKDGDII